VIDVNGRRYALARAPIVVVCVDGCEPGLSRPRGGGRRDALARIGACRRHLARRRLRDAVLHETPTTFSIVTGAPPSVHGISGITSGIRRRRRVMMNDPKYLRAENHPGAAGRAPAPRWRVVTAKDKLRRLLGHGMTNGICFSSEKANETTEAEHGLADALAFRRPAACRRCTAPTSASFVFAAGVRLMETRRPDVMYLSTTDYVQHKHAPGTPAADAFYRMMDGYLERLDALGATIALTADHGMNAKTDAAGRPQVVYLQDVLDAWLGAGRARVILPITDPYVVHHGALGSFRHRVPAAEARVEDALARLDRLPRHGGGARPQGGVPAVRAARGPDRRRGRGQRAFTPSSAPRPRATTSRASTRRCARTAGSPNSACRSC